MPSRRLLALLVPLLLILASCATARPTRAELQTPHWWLQQALHETARIAPPQDRAKALVSLGFCCDSHADSATEAAVAAAMETFAQQCPTVTFRPNPEWFARNAKVHEFAAAGKFPEAMAFIDQIPDRPTRLGLRHTLIVALGQCRQTDALRVAANSGLLTPDEFVPCISGLLNDARIRLDKSAAESALDLLPSPDLALSALNNCLLYSMPDDPRGTRFVIELMPDIPARAGDAWAAAHNLAHDGYAQDALALAILVPVKNRRADLLGDIAKALVADGHDDDARQLVAGERDPACIAHACLGLALGLALRGDADAANAAYNQRPTGQTGGDASELQVAILTGAALHGSFPSALAQLRAAPADARQRALRDIVPRLIKARRLDDATQIVALADEDISENIAEKCLLLRDVGNAHIAAHQQPALRQTLATLDGLLPRIPDKNNTTALYALAYARASLGDAEAMLATAASLPAAPQRDMARRGIVVACAESGDFKSLARTLAAAESSLDTPPAMRTPYMMAAIASMNGNLEDLPAWIASWPDAADRTQGYMAVANAPPNPRLIALRTDPMPFAATSP